MPAHITDDNRKMQMHVLFTQSCAQTNKSLVMGVFTDADDTDAGGGGGGGDTADDDSVSLNYFKIKWLLQLLCLLSSLHSFDHVY